MYQTGRRQLCLPSEVELCSLQVTATWPPCGASSSSLGAGECVKLHVCGIGHPGSYL